MSEIIILKSVLKFKSQKLVSFLFIDHLNHVIQIVLNDKGTIWVRSDSVLKSVQLPDRLKPMHTIGKVSVNASIHKAITHYLVKCL